MEEKINKKNKINNKTKINWYIYKFNKIHKKDMLRNTKPVIQNAEDSACRNSVKLLQSLRAAHLELASDVCQIR